MRALFAVFLVAIDLAAYYLALETAVLSRVLIDILFPSVIRFGFSFSHFASLWWIPIFLVAVFAYKGLYNRRLTSLEEIKTLLGAVTFALVIVFAFVSVLKLTDMVSRLTLFFIWIYGLIIFPLARIALKKVLYKLGIGTEKLMVIGTGTSAVDAASALLNEQNYGYEIKGFYSTIVSEHKTVRLNEHNYPVLQGDIETMLDDCKTVVFVEADTTQGDLSDLASSVRRKAGTIITVPSPDKGVMMNSEFHYLFTNKLFILKSRNNLASTANILAKRVFDIVFTILVSPFVILIIICACICVRYESKGAVFYTHKRMGHGGKTINVYKMRSMYSDADKRLEELLSEDPALKAEWESSFKLKDDPRVTKVGTFLRKTSIDEMPQFLNVLKGDMSVVGPRPVIKQELDEFYGKDSLYYNAVRPGITGLWQVSGRSDTDYAYRVGLDRWYVMNWSLWLDIMIILKTVKAVIKKEGAY
jgi:Undecaprenyl-phosphate galactose phosphotransferase WbaP